MAERSSRPSTPSDLPSSDVPPKANSSLYNPSEPRKMDRSTMTWNPGRKRKQSPSNDDFLVDRVLKSLFPGDPETSTRANDHGTPFKKHKAEADKAPGTWSRLPKEVWQYVFTFLDPKTLGLLLRTNKTFKTYLTSNESYPQDQPTQGALKPMNSALIWSNARKAYFPGMPRPLANRTELDMWKLVGATNCQFCKKPDPSSSSTASSPWENGPGVDGVRIIWSFGIRVCSECLFARTRKHKEMDVLLSSLPVSLLPGLCFALVTSSMHVVSSVAIKINQLPTDLQITKYYYNDDIRSLMDESERVKALGSAALEEWTKGLESERISKMTDIARWEQWEKSGGLQDVRAKFETTAKSSMHFVNSSDNNLGSKCVTERGSTSEITHTPPRVVSQGSQPSLGNNNDSNSRSPDVVPQAQQGRVERSLSDVNEAKRLRKLEIERRCAELDPPLTPAVLSHMDSFSAAIQIPNVLTDRDWDILLPRLLFQREAAEKKELMRLENEKLLQAKSEEHRREEALLREAKASLDRQWEEVQRPIRDQLALYAEEFTNKNWDDGNATDQDKCAQFAANILTHVRSKFYARVKEEDDLARASGIPVRADSPDKPSTRRLILENMKWIFETKVKPITERFQKELFLCNECENPSRSYGFESVIQHYAAKHTKALSRGSVVVYWRAEWPEKPPFHPNPNAAKAMLHASAQSGFKPVNRYTGQQNTPTMYMATPEQHHRMMTESLQSPHSFGHSPFGGSYAFGPYQPPSPRISSYYPTPQSGYVFPVTPAVTTSAYDQPPHAYSPSYGMHASPATYPSHMAQARHAYPSPAYAPSSPYMLPISNDAKPSGGQLSDPERRATYQNHLNEMARISRDVWNATSGIKDLPASIRAHTLIYHVVSACKRQLNLDVSIFLFADGLNSHAQMKPLRNLQSLVCKLCTDREKDPLSNPRSWGAKSFNFHALISHFYSTHIEHASSGFAFQGDENRSWDWKTDMILLPDSSTIESSLRAPGMDDIKLQIISQALQAIVPNLFRVQLQTAEPVRSPATSHRRESGLRSDSRLEPVDWEDEYLIPADSYETSSQYAADDAKSGVRESTNMHIRNNDTSGRPRYYVPSARTLIKQERRQSDPAPTEMDGHVSREAPGIYTHGGGGPEPQSSRSSETRTRLRASELSESPNFRSHRYVWLTPDQYDTMADARAEPQDTNEISRYGPGYSLDDAVFVKNEDAFTSAVNHPKSLTDEVGEPRLYHPEANMGEALSSRRRSQLRTAEGTIWHPVFAANGMEDQELTTSRDDYKTNRIWRQQRDLVPVQEVDVRRQNRVPGSPELGNSRFGGRKLSGPIESRRPHSRFDRYEAQRQHEPLRPRSRSSSIKEVPHLDSHFFHEQSQRDQTMVPRYYIDQPTRSFARGDITHAFKPAAKQDGHEFSQDFTGSQRYYDSTAEP